MTPGVETLRASRPVAPVATTNKERPMLPNLNLGPSVRLRPGGHLSLAALEAALAIREQARLENAAAETAGRTPLAPATLTRSPSFAALVRQRQAFSTWSSAASLAAHSFAWLLADMLGTGPWTPLERWSKGVSMLLDGVGSSHLAARSRLVDHVTAYRHHNSLGLARWHDTAFVLQPYMPDAQLAAALAALNAGQGDFCAEAIPRSWGWYAPDNSMTRIVLVFGRVHTAPAC